MGARNKTAPVKSKKRTCVSIRLLPESPRHQPLQSELSARPLPHGARWRSSTSPPPPPPPPPPSPRDCSYRLHCVAKPHDNLPRCGCRASQRNCRRRQRRRRQRVNRADTPCWRCLSSPPPPPPPPPPQYFCQIRLEDELDGLVVSFIAFELLYSINAVSFAPLSS